MRTIKHTACPVVGKGRLVEFGQGKAASLQDRFCQVNDITGQQTTSAMAAKFPQSKGGFASQITRHIKPAGDEQGGPLSGAVDGFHLQYLTGIHADYRITPDWFSIKSRLHESIKVVIVRIIVLDKNCL